MIRFRFTINEHSLFIDIPMELILYAKKHFARPLYLWIDDKPLKTLTGKYRLRLTVTTFRTMKEYYPFFGLRLQYVPSCPDKYFLCLLDATATTIHSFPLTVDIGASS